ncbi:MAG: aldo/keto reductase [Myxococcales bacterium]|nr:aldo/keto reductase [Myxococcales bacterium]
MPNIELANGDTMPALGLGTWKAAPGEVAASVKEAIRVGYRHIDCAWVYGNEAEIGAALAECFAEGLVTREQLWITSKLWCDRHRPEDVRPALEGTLADLQLEHLDLYLVHWPVALVKGVPFPRSAADMRSLDEAPLRATWAGLEDVVDAGLARHIGVSNFSARKLGALLERARRRPEVNQIELHPYLQQTALLEFCARHDVHVTAYSPLGSRDRPSHLRAKREPVLLEDPLITEIAAAHGATPAQVLLAWALRRGTSALAKSVHPMRLRENFAAGELRLGEEDMRAIATLERHRRYLSGEVWALEGGPYTLANLWDE